MRHLLVALLTLALVTTGTSVVYNHLTSTPSAVLPLDAHGHVVATGDVRTHYESWGDAGSAVVLVPGFAESSYVFDALGPILAAAHHRVFALDVRGYGYTERRGPYTLASDTRQLADFLRVLHLRRTDGVSTVVVGHSSGAAIAGDLALTRPADVAGIVFLDGDGTPYGVGPAWAHALVRDPFATSLSASSAATRRWPRASTTRRAGPGARRSPVPSPTRGRGRSEWPGAPRRCGRSSGAR